MNTKTVDIQEVEGRWQEVLAWVREGTEVILTEDEKPVVRLSPMQRIPDLFPGGWISDDFDDPLPDEFWLGEE
ncbi:MAG TPA: hypothetical protein VHP83_14815 [Aggregatilineaceae bacterium]|nr:hypothetical protein [Aggregatilineaceae bacterium]